MHFMYIYLDIYNMLPGNTLGIHCVVLIFIKACFADAAHLRISLVKADAFADVNAANSHMFFATRNKLL